MTPWDLAKSGSEAGEQRALMAWCSMAETKGIGNANDIECYSKKYPIGKFPSKPIPQLKWLHAIHNQGHGDAIRGGIAKAEGVKAGVADLFLPVPMQYPRSHSHGLYIEMKKVKGGMQSDIQKEFETDVKNEGYQYSLCKGWIEARDCILNYLGLA